MLCHSNKVCQKWPLNATFCPTSVFKSQVHLVCLFVSQIEHLVAQQWFNIVQASQLHSSYSPGWCFTVSNAITCSHLKTSSCAMFKTTSWLASSHTVTAAIVLLSQCSYSVVRNSIMVKTVSFSCGARFATIIPDGRSMWVICPDIIITTCTVNNCFQ